MGVGNSASSLPKRRNNYRSFDSLTWPPAQGSLQPFAMFRGRAQTVAHALVCVMSRFVWIPGLGVLLALCPLASAQDTAAISGQVQDATGAAVGDATVTARNLETGTTRVVITGSDGNFRVLSLPLGRHEIKAEKAGFKSAVRTGITLEVGQEAVVSLRLEVGQIAESVVVVEGAPLVNTTPSPISGMVGEQSVKELPLNGRSFDNLITLNPGAINYTSMKSVNTTTSDGNSFSVAGRRPQDNLFLLNGIEYTGTSQLAVTPGGVSGYLLGIDAVREFNLLTDTYGAQYGNGREARCSSSRSRAPMASTEPYSSFSVTALSMSRCRPRSIPWIRAWCLLLEGISSAPH